MSEISTISAFQRIFSSFSFTEPTSFPEDFAQKRYLKKMEIPDSSRSAERKEACFRTFVEFDGSLRLPKFLPGNWYKARLLIHEWCKSFRLDPLVFTNGSEAQSTRGFNSIESKLMRSAWECTPECWDLWAITAYENLALRRATRARFAAIMLYEDKVIKQFHRESYSMFREHKNYKFLCFARTLSRVTMVREASRFSTVRKNNEVDRPIDLQPLCNMLVQRRIGNGFRSLLRRQGVDLDTLAATHVARIVDSGLATIDLKNASDSIHIDLIRFLFPKYVFDAINASRTYYTEGLDGNFYVTNKVSAMGNGFTFELMTVVIRALGLQHDSNFSVFGDDILIVNESARSLIRDLTCAGFIVNEAKSFIDSKFRESCGGNYHDDFGYIESYDFRFPENIHDCVVLNNKAYALGLKYPSFKKLSQLLLRAVPRALQGPAYHRDVDGDGRGRQGYDQDIDLSTTFWAKSPGGSKIDASDVRSALSALCYNPDDFTIIYGYRWKAENASPRRTNISMRRSTGKYFMYLWAGRICDDILTDRGSWQKVAYATNGQATFRLKSLVR